MLLFKLYNSITLYHNILHIATKGLGNFEVKIYSLAVHDLCSNTNLIFKVQFFL